MFALHLVVGASIGLSVDEAHYLLYAAHPALSYFDHPPLVGWVQWPLVALHAPVACLRLVPALAWLGTAMLVHSIAMALVLRSGADQATGMDAAPAAEHAGLWSLVALCAAPLVHVLGIGLLPDSLLMLWAAALMRLTMALTVAGAEKRNRLWAGLGLLLGLAGLSKYTAVLPASAVAICLLQAHGLRVLRNPRLWLAAQIALVLIAPVGVWNAQHGWVSFNYQADHGAGGHWRWLDLGRYLLVQWLAYGVLLWWGWCGVRSENRGEWFLRLFFVIPFGVHVALSGGGTGLPHWTAPAWVALAPFAGKALASGWQSGRRAWTKAWLAFQFACCVALLGLMLSAGWPLVAGSDAEVAPVPNPFADLHGWEQAGARAQVLAAQQGLRSVTVQNWTLASRIGWYSALPVHVLEDRFTQFDLWAGKLPQGGSTLLLDWSYLPYEVPQAQNGFERCNLLELLPVQHWGQPLARFAFYDCRGWAGEPQPRLKLPPTP